jgi:hypothetical protein
MDAIVLVAALLFGFLLGGLYHATVWRKEKRELRRRNALLSRLMVEPEPDSYTADLRRVGEKTA